MLDFMSNKKKLDLIKSTLYKIYTREEGPDTPLHKKISELSTKVALKRFTALYKGELLFSERRREDEQQVERE